MKKFNIILALFLLATAPAFAATSGSGRKSVTTGGTAEALTATTTPFTKATICADPDNTGKVSVGAAPVASTTVPEGIYLNAGDCYTVERQYGDLSTVKADVTVNGESVTYEWQYR